MKTRSRTLVVEDDRALREEIVGCLRDEGYPTESAGSVKEGGERLRAGAYDLVITDLQLPDASGLDIVRQVRAGAPDCPVLVITAYASIGGAVEAMRQGAFHYLPKPFSIEALIAEAEKALDHGRVLRERRGLREQISASQGLGRLLGESPAMESLRRMIREVATADSTVLVTGETGTGKELVAEAVHYEGPRAGAALIKVNCAALSESLLESELFGHERGAFTGAERARAGRFERADGGSLFLDEISEMGVHLQAKLLRVLQGEPFERVGGDEALRPDVRVIAATNRDPQKAVAEGRLRQDLYYRLNIVHLAIPPLRERREDVPLLAAHFLAACAVRLGRPAKSLSPAATAALAAHDWPGNVRELQNCVERAVILSHGEVLEPGDLPAPVSGQGTAAAAAAGAAESAEAPEPKAALDLREVERRTILQALAASGGNKARAAESLGIFPASLYKKMRRLKIPLGKKK